MNRSGTLSKRLEMVELFFIGGLVVFPLFFQLDGGIFRDDYFYFDSGRLLKRLPIPFSVIALAVGILLLRRFHNVRRSLTVFFSTALLLAMAALFVGGLDKKLDRLILMAQYLLPFSGLVLGEMYGAVSENKEFEKVCLFVTCTIVPAQLICSWIQGFFILAPYLYHFSIHQHLQYVPFIIVLAYGIAFSSLWNERMLWRVVLTILLPWIVMYVIAAYSFLTLAIFLGFVFLFLFVVKPPLVTRRVAIWILVIILTVGVSYYMVARTRLGFLISQKLTFVSVSLSGGYQGPEESKEAREAREAREEEIAKMKIRVPKNLAERVYHWRFYGAGVFDSIKGFFLGHPNIPNRILHPSAHNYYLDLAYNYGFLPLIPLLSLIIYTILVVYRLRGSVLADPSLFAVIFTLFAVFVADNSLKVGLRQPYSGIFGFFVLGFLLARLKKAKSFPADRV